MSEFEPTTDFEESIDDDDNVVESSASFRDETVQRKRRTALRALTVVAFAALVIAGFSWWRAAVAMAAAYLLLAIGVRILGAFARPIPDAPPPGELRRVKLVYRCPSCGAELRMTLANDTVPAPPRHCADEMELLTDLEDIL